MELHFHPSMNLTNTNKSLKIIIISIGKTCKGSLVIISNKIDFFKGVISSEQINLWMVI